VPFHLYLPVRVFVFSSLHTAALAQERAIVRPGLLGRRSLIRVHPTRLAPCHFIASVLPTKHLPIMADHDELFELPAFREGG